MSMPIKTKSTSEFEQLSIEETFKLLEASMHGLTEAEAKNRLEKFGYNEITEEKKNPFIDFLSVFGIPCLGYWN